MIDRAALLSDLQTLLKRLEADLLERSESTEIPDVGQALRAEYERAKKAERTAQNYEDWRSDAITQAAAAWVLSCVFVRFLEDNKLIDTPKIAGPKERLQQARDEHTLYFHDSAREKLTDREYLLRVFDELAKLPGTKDVFGEHNPIRVLPNWLSGDEAGELLRFFQKIDANTGNLIHDFGSDQRSAVSGQQDKAESRSLNADSYLDTRFLGDLYQDLSEASRKKYALLQTPEFVEEFILDRTLEPALDEFGLEPGAISSQRSAVSKSGGDSRYFEAESGSLTADRYFKMIDPACGSGHFLLGSFRRILDRWQKQEPDGKVRDLVQRTLDCIHGVDVNPYAVAIARFRLLLVAMRTCGVQRLADAPAFRFHLACGDSLLHSPLKVTATETQGVFDWELTSGDAECEHAYQAEDLAVLKKILRSGQYHAVVANPPYITPKDRQLNQRYRKRYATCHMKYSLAVPFMERIFRLAVNGGFTGQITANSFMKREFGKKLIESFLPTVDLTHLIDTSGAYIPGHGTPTVILFGRHRRPVATTIRTVMGIRGEPSTPDDPARGLVWSAIVTQMDQPGSQSEFVSVGDSSRELFSKHPWSIGGGGAAELKERLDESVTVRLREIAAAIGITAVTGEDELFMQPEPVLRRFNIEFTKALVEGNVVRDWQINSSMGSVWLYDDKFDLLPLEDLHATSRLWWVYRAAIYWRKRFGSPLVERGLTWYEWQELYTDKLRTPLSIVFGEVATHNHFVLDRGGKVFKQTAPVIKLAPDASEEDHLVLLGLLNSSTACFWMKQVCFPKGGDHVGQEGARVRRSLWDERYAFNATNLQQFPIPEDRPLRIARNLDRLAQQLSAVSPKAILMPRRDDATENRKLGASAPLREALATAYARYHELRRLIIFHQEELDWECYRLYSLIDDDLTYRSGQQTAVSGQQEEKTESDSLIAERSVGIKLGQRAFEIVLARKIASNEVQSTWFERHGSTPITDLPAEWPDDYRQLVARRIKVIESNPEIALIEKPEYKRRWNSEPWESQVECALRNWLLARLESYFDFDGRMCGQPSAVSGQPDKKADCRSLIAESTLTTVAKLADIARQDAEFVDVGEVYRDDSAFDVQRLVEELVRAESVPLLPVLRYKPPGLRKRKEWERTWELQREEDKRSAISDQQSAAEETPTADKLTADRRQLTADGLSIPVPPKYTSSDFISTGGARYWSLRGKLDVPKERWVSFPHCEGADGTLAIAWAGYDHLQLARAISAYFVDIQERLGGRDDPRLVPLLACIIELLPWLKQWHHEIDPDYNQRMDEVFEGFVIEEAKNLGITIDEIKAWQPPKRSGGRGIRRAGK